MRKVIVSMSVSLDGFIEGPDREIDWHLVDDELHSHFNEQLATVDAFLSGRVTYELMAGFWPTADSDPSSTGPVADFARIWRDMTKIVYSRTLKEVGWNTTIVREVVPDEVRALKAQPGGDLALGGADLVTAFRRTAWSTSTAFTSTRPHRRRQTPVPGVGHQAGSPARRDQAVRQRGRAPPVRTLTWRYRR